MKKSKLLAVALIGLMLAGGLVLASCRAGCEGAGTCKWEGKTGSACTNVNYNNSTGKVTGCAVNVKRSKAAGGNVSTVECDC